MIPYTDSKKVISMNYKVGKSSKSDLKEAISEATIGLKSPKLILFLMLKILKYILKKLEKNLKTVLFLGLQHLQDFVKMELIKIH